jgi:hypothetical protein
MELEQIRVALDQMASEARKSVAPSPGLSAASIGAPLHRSIQVIVEIEARAVTVERLFRVSERQEWTFGETLEYALDALELALANMALVRAGPADRHRPSRLGDLLALQRLLRLSSLVRPLLLSEIADLAAPAGLLPPSPLCCAV